MEEETLKEDKNGNCVTLRWGENTKYKEEDKNKETLREDINGKRDTKRKEKDLGKRKRNERRLEDCFVTPTIGFWFCKGHHFLFSSLLFSSNQTIL